MICKRKVISLWNIGLKTKGLIMKYRIFAVLILLIAMPVSAPLQAGWLEHTISTPFSGGTSVKAVDIDEDGDMDSPGCPS